MLFWAILHSLRRILLGGCDPYILPGGFSWGVEDKKRSNLILFSFSMILNMQQAQDLFEESNLEEETRIKFNETARIDDDEAYRKIREYHFKNERSNETRWWARLSSHKSRNLKKLLRHKDLIAAFDSLLKISALLEGMRINTLHKMFVIKCDEINSLIDFWSRLIDVKRYCIIFAT